MADKKISQLDIISTVTGEEYIIVDNNVTTSRTAINTLSSLYTPINNYNALYESVARIDGSLINILSLSALTYTLQLSNLGTYIRKFHTSAHTIVIPTSASIPFAVGSTFTIRNTGTSSLTISASPTVTLTYYTDLSANILDQYASAQIVCVETNSWDII